MRQTYGVSAFLLGLLSSLALIVAIGAQNAFVLRQGLRREHVIPIITVCIVADALLIAAGVAGLGAVVQTHQGLLTAIRFVGAAFLLAYAALALRRSLKANSMATDLTSPGLSLRAAVSTSLAFTFLNPHVYLDTVVLLGGIGAQQPLGQRPWFVLGGALASAIWFVSLGLGARRLAPLFARPKAWRVLDGAIAAVMATLAAVVALG